MSHRAGVLVDPGPFNPTKEGRHVHFAEEIQETAVLKGPKLDLLEQKHAQEHSQFFERFNLLKEWQREQQAKLLSQQQEQLQMLRSEQEKVQKALAVQRQKQWGGLQVTSSPKSLPPLQSSVASETNLLMKAHGPWSLDAMLQDARQSIHNQDESLNSEDYHESFHEDGIFPLPDTASECSEIDVLHSERLDERVLAVEEQSHDPMVDSGDEVNDIQQDVGDTSRTFSSPFSSPRMPSSLMKPSSPQTSSTTGIDQPQEPTPKTSTNLDDKPVMSKLGHKMKTFDELIDEQMRVEEDNQVKEEDKPKAKKHSFLKKGEGIARFGKFKIPPPARINSQKKGVKSLSLKHNKPKLEQKESPNRIGEEKDFVKNHEENHNQPTSYNQSSLSRAVLPLSSGTVKGQPRSVHKTMVGNSAVSKEKLPQGSPVGALAPLKQSETSVNNTIEMSFQQGIKRWQKTTKIEQEELDEFEMLEQAAEDNASFSSENSLVVGVLQRAQMRKQMLLCSSPLKQFKRLPTLESVDSSTQDAQEEEKQSAVHDISHDRAPDLSHDQIANLSHIEPDEDTSLEEDQIQNQEPELEGDDLDETLKSHIDSEKLPVFKRFIGRGQSKSDNNDDSAKESSDDNLYEEGALYGEGEDHLGGKGLETEKRKDYTSKSENEASSGVKGLGTFKSYGTNQNNGLQDSDSSRGSEEEEQGAGGSNSSSTTKYPPRLQIGGKYTNPGQDSEERVPSVVPSAQFDFEDDETWGDLSGQLSDSSDDSTGASDPLSQNSGEYSKGTSSSVLDRRKLPGVSSSHSVAVSPPPVSNLVAKLFPQLKPKVKDKEEREDHGKRFKELAERPVGEGVQSKILKDKLMELENEIERFRKENAALARLRDEREKDLKMLRKEIDEFQKQRSEELQKIQEFRDQEMKKLRKEKKVFEKYRKSVQALPAKQEKEEMEALKTQLSNLQDEFSRRESHWSANSRRLRDRISILEKQNEEMRGKIEAQEQKELEEAEKQQKKKQNARSKALREAGKQAQSLLPKPVTNQNYPPLPSNLHLTSEQDKLPTTINPQSPPTRLSLPDAETSPHANLPKETTPSHRKTVSRPVEPDVMYSQQTSSQTLAANVISPAKSYGMSSPMKQSEFEEIYHPGGKIEHIQADGSRVIKFENGTRIEISGDGQTVTVTFFNGDTKQILPDQRVVYYYSETQTRHTTYPDGLEILQFPNNQTEKHYPDGTKEIIFPDQTIKYLFPNGSEESVFSDGTVLKVDTSGEQIMEFPNGQREIHTAQYKKREFPDGTVKTVYPDGRQETRYPNGRLRVKDKDGNILVDRVC